jgi:hypothetical protein
MIASVVLIARSILHIRRTEALSSDEKTTWFLLVLFLGFITLPVYWHVIARRPPRSGKNGAWTATA